MLFCNVELAARIERAERDLVAAACAKAEQRLGAVSVTPVGGGLAAFTEPGSPLNKVVGLGFAPLDKVTWHEIEAAHRERDAALQVEFSTLGDPDVGRWLSGRGYELVGVENVLGRTLAVGAAPKPPAGVHVAESRSDEFEVWLDVTVTGFGAADVQGVPAHEEFDRVVVERIIRDFAGAADFLRYLARRDGTPAGGATMRLSDGIAQLCGAATLPAHRRQGIQSALLQYRLDAAARQGCSIAVVTTQPGSKSQQNVQRIGFELLYSRNVLRREAW